MTVTDCQPRTSRWEQLLGLRMRLRQGLRVRYARTGDAPGFLTDSDGGRSYALAPWQCQFLDGLRQAEAISDVVRTVIRDAPETATRRNISDFVAWLQEKRFLTALESPLEIGRVNSRAFTDPDLISNKPPLFLRCVMHVITAAVLAVGFWKLNSSFHASADAAELSERIGKFADAPETVRDWISVRASCAGVLTEVLVKPGDRIESGDLVARIVDPEIRDRLGNLRKELGECRIRRDRFYRQGNRPEYLRELQQLAAISQELGENQARAYLGEMRAPVSGKVIGGVRSDRIGSRVTEGDEVIKVRLPESESSDPDLLAEVR